MIHVVFSGPCVWDPKQRGLGDIQLAYMGVDPLKTALEFISRNPSFRLCSVVKDGHVYYNDL